MPIRRLPKIDPAAVARVKDRKPTPRACSYCGGRIVILDHSEIYGKSFNNWPYVYACAECDARVGMHPQTDIPLGTLADSELRSLRKKGKEMWKKACFKRGFSRSVGYKWLAALLDCPLSEAHWGFTTKAQCNMLIEALSNADADAAHLISKRMPKDH